MRIVVDTNVFWHLEALAELQTRVEDVVVPAVVFAERCRQRFRDRGLAPGSFRRFLDAVDFQVEPMAPDQAVRFSHRIADARWPRLSRDALIAGHVGPDDVLWTANGRDFIEVGLEASQIHAI